MWYIYINIYIYIYMYLLFIYGGLTLCIKIRNLHPKCVCIYIYTHTHHDSWQAQLNNVQFLRFMPILLWGPYTQPGPALEEVRHLTLIGSSNYFEVLGSWNLLLIDQQVPYIWESQQQEHLKCLQQLEHLCYYRCKCLIFQYRLQSLAGLWVRKKMTLLPRT